MSLLLLFCCYYHYYYRYYYNSGYNYDNTDDITDSDGKDKNAVFMIRSLVVITIAIMVMIIQN